MTTKKKNPEPRPQALQEAPKLKDYTLTFVLPTFNREKTIGGALSEITRQISKSKHKDKFSVVVSENHSKDRSGQIAQSYADRFPFVKVVSPPKHLGSGEQNLFFALEHIKSDLVWSFADDDILLPGAIDSLYECVSGKTDVDFFLINSQYADSDGEILSDRLIEIDEDFYQFSNFQKLFCEIGPLTLLASFSSVIYKAQPMQKIDLKRHLEPCDIYAHVFAYLNAFHASQVGVIKSTLVALRKTTSTNHWEHVARRRGWYTLYPWTGGLAAHLYRAKSEGYLESGDYGYALNTNELGRYGLLENLLTQFILQLIKAAESGDPIEIPSPEDFELIRKVVDEVSFVTIDTLDLLQWCEKNFKDICLLLAPKNSECSMISSSHLSNLRNMGLGEELESWLNTARAKFFEKLHRIKENYVHSGTMSTTAKPHTLLKSNNHALFRLGIRSIVIQRHIFDEDWRLMQPNKMDGVSKEPNWYVFNETEEAIKRYFELERKDTPNPTNFEQSKLFDEYPWKLLKDDTEESGINAFITGFERLPEFQEIREEFDIIVNNKQRATKRKGNTDQLFESGFINLGWYQDQYSHQTNGFERELIRESPVLHYLSFGWRKNWCISPYFDEQAFIAPITRGSAPLRPSLPQYLQSDFQGEISSLFSVVDYKLQCSEKQIELIGIPVIHFLTSGAFKRLTPHPKWNESAYRSVNRDVEAGLQSHPFIGWQHWCAHGRFEKRKGGF